MTKQETKQLKECQKKDACVGCPFAIKKSKGLSCRFWFVDRKFNVKIFRQIIGPRIQRMSDL